MLTIILIAVVIVGLLVLFSIRDSHKVAQWTAQHIVNVAEANAAPRVRPVENDQLPDDYDIRRDLFVPVLSSLGTEPQYDEEKHIRFSYQGLNFALICPSNSPQIRLCLPEIIVIAGDDPKVPQIIEIGNAMANRQWGVRFEWHRVAAEENGQVVYHFSLSSDKLLAPNDPDPKGIMTLYLDAFSEAVATLRVRLAELGEEQRLPPAPGWSIDTSAGFSQEQMN